MNKHEYYVQVGDKVHGIWAIAHFAENHKASLIEQGEKARIITKEARK